MPWTIHADPVKRTFSIRGSSPGPVTTPAYLRQVEITRRLGGKVLAAFPRIGNSDDESAINGIEEAGYEPHVVPLDPAGFTDLLKQVEHHAMQDDRGTKEEGLLIASPFGFVQLADSSTLNDLFPPPITEVLFDDVEGTSDKPADGG